MFLFAAKQSDASCNFNNMNRSNKVEKIPVIFIHIFHTHTYMQYQEKIN